MNIFTTILLTVQTLSAIAMIALVLMQQGKGADAGAVFGNGSGSASLFGASGSANFLSRSTSILATIFFATTLALAYVGDVQRTTNSSGSGSVLEGASGLVPSTVSPATPASSSLPTATTSSSTAPSTSSTGTGAAQIPGK